MQSQKQKRPLKPSPFILKLWEILETPAYRSMISWAEDQQSFVVHAPYQFSQTLLPKYFRHCNYGSFLRQLNLYSFIKLKNSNDSVNQFQHPLFGKGKDDQLSLIKRQKTRGSTSAKDENDPIINDSLPSNLSSSSDSLLEVEINSLRASQSKLLEQCQQLLQQGNQTIQWGFIKSAQLQNDSAHNQIICNKIFDFIKGNPHLREQFQYLDTGIINNILEHLGENRPLPPVIDSFFRMVETNELWEVLQSFQKGLGRERKSKSYTIVGKKEAKWVRQTKERGLPPCQPVIEGESGQK